MGLSAKLRVGAFQFAGSAEIQQNVESIRRGIKQAKRRRVRLLALPECALCGYPGVDREDLSDCSFEDLRRAQKQVSREAQQAGLMLSLGSTRPIDGGAQNILQLVGADGRIKQTYAKRMMYGCDENHFRPGKDQGRLSNIDGLRVGLRICFEFRFPEYFRELLRQRAQLVVMGFAMVGPTAEKYATAKAHLISRAAENGFWILAANSISQCQNAPTCLIDPDGQVLEEAPRDQEALIVGSVDPTAGSPLSRVIPQLAGAFK